MTVSKGQLEAQQSRIAVLETECDRHSTEIVANDSKIGLLRTEADQGKEFQREITTLRKMIVEEHSTVANLQTECGCQMAAFQWIDVIGLATDARTGSFLQRKTEFQSPAEIHVV
jgi:hypothetical protein